MSTLILPGNPASASIMSPGHESKEAFDSMRIGMNHSDAVRQIKFVAHLLHLPGAATRKGPGPNPGQEHVSIPSTEPLTFPQTSTFSWSTGIITGSSNWGAQCSMRTSITVWFNARLSKDITPTCLASGQCRSIFLRSKRSRISEHWSNFSASPLRSPSILLGPFFGMAGELTIKSLDLTNACGLNMMDSMVQTC